MDNEKINGVPEEETELQETEEVNETVQEESVPEEAPEETAEESAEKSEEELPEKPAEEAGEEQEEISDEAEAAPEDAAEETEEMAEDTSAETEEDPEEEIAEEQEEEIEENELCGCCGEKRSEEGSDYCADCEAKMLSRKIPFFAWLGGLIVVVLSVFALALATLVAAPSIKVARGDAFARDNCWYSAYREYSDVNSVIAELNSIIGEETPFIKMGNGLVYKIIDTVANTASPLDAIGVADSLLGQNSTETHSALKKYSKLRSEYMATYELLEPTLTAMQYGGASFETTVESFERFRDEEGVSKVLVDYFIFTAAVYYGEDVNVRLESLDALDKTAKESGEDYSWLYYQDYADVLFEAGQSEKAAEYVDALIESDKTKFGAFELKIRMALSEGNLDGANAVLEEFKKYNEGYDTAYVLESTLLRVSGKTEEAKLLITEALEEYSSVPELYRQLALIYLMEGDIDKAYETADEAVYNALYLYNYMNDRSTITAQLVNTAYVCDVLAEKNGSASAGSSMWISQLIDGMVDEDLPEKVLQAVNGEKTWKEILTEGECDLI